MKLINYGVCQPWPKLGDSIVYHSAFIHYGECQWVNVQQTKKIPLQWKWVSKKYAEDYEWKVNTISGTRHPGNFMRECLNDGVMIARMQGSPHKKLEELYPDGYVTSQIQGLARSNGKPAPQFKRIKAVKHDLPVVDIGAFKGPLDILQSVIMGAEEHIGVDSGGAWLALACGRPTTVISTMDKMDDAYKPLHYNALQLLEANGATIK